MSERKFLVWTKKGGCGKTNISLELSLRMQYPIITNEAESMLETVIGPERCFTLSDNDDIPNIDSGVIFDFGGYVDKRLIRAASLSYATIVPTLPEISEIQGCISTIQALKEYSNRIIVIANKTETKADFDIIKEAISDIGDFPIFEVKKSRALPNIYIEKKSIKDMMETNPLLKFSYRKVSDQFDEICHYLLNVE